jgi:S1-C subfamily serine protease
MKEAGIPKGFFILKINDKPMYTIEDFENVVKSEKQNKNPMLVIRGIYPTGKKGGFVVYL